LQLVPREYVIFAVPIDTPKTLPTPIPELTVAIPVLLLVQVPPPASNNVVVDPAHIVIVPVIGEGVETTVKVAFAAHPDGNV